MPAPQTPALFTAIGSMTGMAQCSTYTIVPGSRYCPDNRISVLVSYFLGSSNILFGAGDNCFKKAAKLYDKFSCLLFTFKSMDFHIAITKR